MATSSGCVINRMLFTWCLFAKLVDITVRAERGCPPRPLCADTFLLRAGSSAQPPSCFARAVASVTASISA